MERLVINLVKRRNSPIIIVPEKENLIKMAIKLQYCAQFTGCDTWTAIGAMEEHGEQASTVLLPAAAWSMMLVH